jgi:hypothetical protein
MAGFVSVDEFGGALVVGFADRQFDTSEYLMLQRMLDPNDDDGVYLEHNDQGYGTNGKVLSCRLSQNRIEIEVDDVTAQRLRTEPAFAIEFSCDEASWRQLQTGVEQIFSGTDCQLQIPG